MPFNFTVPQFIDVEDKLVGPFSFIQFLYILGGVGFSFLLWRLLPNFIAIILIVPIAALSIALAFVKINNRPFIITFISAIKYYINGKIFLWKKAKKAPTAREVSPTSVQSELTTQKVSGKKLSDIAWSLDVHDKFS